MSLDTQQVEITGRSLLASVFVSEDIEVAEPLRDKGIDLVIYSNDIENFRAIPIQLKAATTAAFSIDKKYEKFPGLYMAYVWRVNEPQIASIYILSYANALKIADELGYTKSQHYLLKGNYAQTRPGKNLIMSLEKYRYVPGNMHKLVDAL